MDSIFDKVKSAVSITDVVARFGVKLNRSHMACCPFHEEKTPSFSVKESEGIYKCFSCDTGGDAIDFVAKIKGIEPIEAVKILADIYGVSEPVSDGTKRVDRKRTGVKPPPRDPNVELRAGIAEYIKECRQNISQTNYFIRRGLTEDTIKHFYLGFDAQKGCVVIPYSSKLNYYQTRSVEGKEFRKPPTEQAGQEPLWNPKALDSSGVVFVVESPICAMSIMQCGGSAVSICGATGGQKLLNEVRDKALKCILVLALDNDPPGQKAQQELANQLFEINKKFITYNISGECKDPNELLMQDLKALAANIREADKSAKQEFSKLKELFSVAELQRTEMPPIKWIVKDLLPQGLSLVTAPSKYGKSWMMMQLCLAVAEGKAFLDRQTVQCDVAYFSLEDSKRRFKDRVNLMTGGKSAPKGFYGSTKALSMATGLFEQLDELMERDPNTGLIVIDIFQKVRGGQLKNESVYGADYREMGLMKNFADKYGICLLLVHHLRKQDDEGDVFNRISGSMAIMGASDTSWVLSRKKRGDENTILTATGRDIKDLELVIAFDNYTFAWNSVGNAADEAARKARAEYEGHPVVKTIKALVEKNPNGWRGNCSEIKLQIYEQTGTLFDGSADSVGRVIGRYLDRLSADGITHVEERGKRHFFVKKQPTLFNYGRYDD